MTKVANSYEGQIIVFENQFSWDVYGIDYLSGHVFYNSIVEVDAWQNKMCCYLCENVYS